MITQRFNTNIEWRNYWAPNHFMYGLFQLIEYLEIHIPHTEHTEMIEIGSYMGESTMLFASSGLFNRITCIDPFEGDEEFNHLFNYTWDEVYSEFLMNTRYFNDIITHHKNFSHEINHIYKDKAYDFIYLDGSHKYEDVKKDLELYLPKLKDDGIISGHDYQVHFGGVMKAVDELVGKPDKIFRDFSWVKKL